MKLKRVSAEVFRIDFGMVSSFLINHDGLTLVDAGLPGSEKEILAAVAALGKRPSDLRDILITHLHSDHSGGAAALKRLTGARIWIHSAEARDLAGGCTMRAVQRGPGLMNRIITGLFMGGPPVKVEPFEPDVLLDTAAGFDLPGGLTAVPSPGHTIGHTSFFRPHEGGVLFAGDACGSMFGLGPSPIYEDLERGMDSLRAFGRLSFDTACLSHGAPITGGADAAFRRKWS